MKTRSECTCQCHKKDSKIIHSFPCCIPDNAEGQIKRSGEIISSILNEDEELLEDLINKGLVTKTSQDQQP